jgi:hypothetical protein
MGDARGSQFSSDAGSSPRGVRLNDRSVLPPWHQAGAGLCAFLPERLCNHGPNTFGSIGGWLPVSKDGILICEARKEVELVPI